MFFCPVAALPGAGVRGCGAGSLVRAMCRLRAAAADLRSLLGRWVAIAVKRGASLQILKPCRLPNHSAALTPPPFSVRTHTQSSAPSIRHLFGPSFSEPPDQTRVRAADFPEDPAIPRCPFCTGHAL